MASSSKGSIIAPGVFQHSGAALRSNPLSSRLPHWLAPRGGSNGTHQPRPSHSGWFARWVGDQHRRIHHEWRGLREAWGRAMQALGKPAELSTIVIFKIWGFLLGIAAVWLYAAIRTRYRPGPNTSRRFLPVPTTRLHSGSAMHTGSPVTSRNRIRIGSRRGTARLAFRVSSRLRHLDSPRIPRAYLRILRSERSPRIEEQNRITDRVNTFDTRVNPTLHQLFNKGARHVGRYACAILH